MSIDLSPREMVLAAILVLCDAFGLVVGARVLARTPASRARFVYDGIVWGLFGASWGIGFSAVTLVVLHSGFAVMRVLTHVLAFVMAPLAIARGIVCIRAARRSAGAVPLAVGLGMLAIYVWAHFVEPRQVEFTEYRVHDERLAGLAAPLRIAILADIQTDHVGSYEEGVFRRTAAARPDVVLLPGDFVQTYVPGRFEVEAARFRALFELLDPWPRLGVHAVFGDVDPVPRLFDGTRVQVVEGAVLSLPGVPGVQLLGLSLAQSRMPYGGELAQRVEAFDGYSIVMGHAPDFAIPIIDGQAAPHALCIAGHTHGGQVVVPGFGPPLTLSSVPRAVAAGGMFEYGAARVCVSRGVGLERGFAPQLRFLCRPQVVLVELGS